MENTQTSNNQYVSFEDIKLLFRETDRKFQETREELRLKSLETDEKFQETDKKFRETREELRLKSLETDKKFQETDKKFQETDKKFQETREELRLKSLETDKKFQETDKKFQETDKRLHEKFQETERLIKESILAIDLEVQKANARIGGLGNSWGDFLEGMAKPGLLEYFTNRGIKVHYAFTNVKEYREEKLYYEIDLLLFNDLYVIAVEVKSKLKEAYITKHLERIKKLQEQPPKVFNLNGKIIIGAIAAISAEPNDIETAIENGFYVLLQKSNIMEAINPPDFTPREWKIE